MQKNLLTETLREHCDFLIAVRNGNALLTEDALDRQISVLGAAMEYAVNLEAEVEQFDQLKRKAMANLPVVGRFQ